MTPHRVLTITLPAVALGVLLAAPVTAAPGDPFGGDDTGCTPTTKLGLNCAKAALSTLTKLRKAALVCHLKQEDLAFKAGVFPPGSVENPLPGSATSVAFRWMVSSCPTCSNNFEMAYGVAPPLLTAMLCPILLSFCATFGQPPAHLAADAGATSATASTRAVTHQDRHRQASFPDRVARGQGKSRRPNSNRGTTPMALEVRRNRADSAAGWFVRTTRWSR